MSSIVYVSSGTPGVPRWLRAVVDEAVLADIQIPGAGAAAPLVRLAVRELFLEVRNPSRDS